MDDAEVTQQPAIAPQKRGRGRPPRALESGTKAEPSQKADELGVRLSWNEIDALVSNLETEYFNERVVRVFCNCEAPALWNGLYTSAPVVEGEPAVQLNTGVILPL